MPTLLQLDSSADLVGSRSRAVTAAFAEAWRARGADHAVVVRDLHRTPVPAIQDVLLHRAPAARPADAALPAEAIALQQELLDELLGADVLLIGAPLYNYTIPASLKAWIEQVHVPGLTAPLAGRPAVVAVARGAGYDPGTPTEGWDHGSPLLELLLGTAMGMEVTVLTTSYTLAESLEALAGFRERARDELEQAIAAARELAGRLG